MYNSARIAIFFLTTFSLLSCNANPKDKKASKERFSDVPVTITKAELKNTPRLITVVSSLYGIKQVDVYSKFAGRISDMGPKEGDRISSGQILFRVDRNDPGESFLNAPIVSPIDGWIGKWAITDIGEQISPADPILTVVDDTSLRAIIYLPLDSWIQLKKETSITVKVAGEERPGKIVVVARSADSASGRGSAIIEIPNKNRTWRAGMVARITL
ncbi:MAG: HlyD family efflux transporter periplasmic adaptor subunit, partial [Oligoflexales bacterium]|nr:HlyD family efflux transporter periplasmic adaptor subunit [Oligoflexales bacterium]